MRLISILDDENNVKKNIFDPGIHLRLTLYRAPSGTAPALTAMVIYEWETRTPMFPERKIKIARKSNEGERVSLVTIRLVGNVPQ